MSRAGLSFTSPMLSAMDVQNPQQYTSPLTPSAMLGQDNLLDSDTDALIKSIQPDNAAMSMLGSGPQVRRSPVRFNTVTREVFAGGMTFNEDDADSALRSFQALSQGSVGEAPQGAGWTDVPEQTYQQYIKAITDPTAGRLFSKNFAIGVDTLQMLGGRGLQLLGAEETGQRIVDQQAEDLRFNQPYQRQFTDIESTGDLGDWFVAALGQAGPSIIETAAIGAAGFAAGTAAGGPLAGAAGALAGVIGKEAFKKKALELASRAAQAKAKGMPLDPVTKRELSRVAGSVAAGTAVFANNYLLGASEVYGELRDKGVDPDDMGAKALALAAGIPMAAVDTVPELYLARKFFSKGYTGNAPLRIGKGLLIGGTMEGTAEAGQENIVMGTASAYTGAEYDDWAARTINAFAAGFAPGSVLGAVSGMKASVKQGEGVDLLSTRVLGTQDGAPRSGQAQDGTAQDGTAQLGVSGEQLEMDLGDLPTQGIQGELDLGTRNIQPVDAQGNVIPDAVEQVQPEDLERQFGQMRLDIDAPPRRVVAPAPTPVDAGQTTMALDFDTDPVTGQMDLPGIEPGGPVQTAPMSVTPELPMVDENQLELEGMDTQFYNVSTGPQMSPMQAALMKGVQAYEARNAKELKKKAEQQAKLEADQRAQARDRDFDMAEEQRLLQQAIQLENARQLQLAQGDFPAGAVAPVAQPAMTKGERLKRGKTAPKAEAKPVAKVEAKPAAKVEAKPAAKVEAKPAAKVEAKPVAKVEAKPAAKTQTLADVISTAIAKVDANPMLRQRLQTLVRATDVNKLAELGKALTGTKAQKAVTQVMEEVYAQTGSMPTPVAATKPRETQVVLDDSEVAGVMDAISSIADGITVDEAVFSLLDTASGNPTTKDGKAAKAEAVSYITSGALDLDLAKSIPDTQTLATIKGDALVRHLAEKATKTGIVKATYNGVPTLWFSWARNDAALMERVARIHTISVSKDSAQDIVDQVTALNEKFTVQAVPKGAKMYQSIANRLAGDDPVTDKELLDALPAELDRIISGAEPLRGAKGTMARSARVANIEAVFDELRNRGLSGTPYRDRTLADYFSEDGALRVVNVDNNMWSVTDTEVTDEVTATKRREFKENAEIADILDAVEDWDTPNDIDEAYNDRARGKDGDYFAGFMRSDNTPATPMSEGKVRLLVANMVSKFVRKPKVSVYRDVADLKSRSPELYKEAKAARKDGTFDSTNASGYAFGDNVIIFSRFIHGEQHLAFTLAHETLGHFGLRAVMPVDKLNYMLDRVYAADADVRMYADRYALTHGVSKREATEEVLADKAATLHASTVMKVWSAIKNFLNKLGFKFDDDLARYWVSQANRYVRNGETGSFMSAANLMQGINTQKRISNNGRYSRETPDMATATLKAMAMNQREGIGRITIENLERVAEAKGVDIKNTLGKALEQVQTLNNVALRSEGLNYIFRFFSEVGSYTRALQSKFNEMTKFTHAASIGQGGPTEQDLQAAGQLLAYGALHNNRKATEQAIRSNKSLVKMSTFGKFIIDDSAVAQAVKFAELTPADFNRGIDVVVSDYNAENEVVGERVVKWKPDFTVTADSPIWKVYQEQRAAVNQGAVEVLISKFRGALEERNDLVNSLDDYGNLGRRVTTQDKLAINAIADKYIELATEGGTFEGSQFKESKAAKQKAEAFLKEVTRVLLSNKKLDDWLNPSDTTDATTKEFANDRAFDDIKRTLPDLAELKMSEKQMYAVQKLVRNAYAVESTANNADFKARKTIMGAYVPFSRRGKYQVRLRAVDAATGDAVRIGGAGNLPYFKTDSTADAEQIAKDLNEAYGGMDLKVLSEDGSTTVNVRFIAAIAEARETPPLSESVSYEDFVRTLNALNVSITPAEYERIVTAMNKSNMTARGNLIRTGNPGWDKDVVRNISEHLETTAHIAAKNIYNHKITRVLTTNDLWRGDKKKLTALAKRVAEAPNAAARTEAQADYDRYAYMYLHMADVQEGRFVMVNGKPMQTKGQGERYREYAKELLAWYNSAGDVAVSSEDALSGELGSRLKLWTVFMQLGGSVATAVLNAFSYVTNMIPYLSGYNSATGFGGGFGIGRSASALYKATANVGTFQSVDALQKMIADGTYKTKHGLTLDEAIYLRNATQQGILQAAQTNALLGNARSGIRSNNLRKGFDTWMSMFTYTEQLTRRSMALATYRLKKEQMIAAGVSPAVFEAKADDAEYANRIEENADLRRLHDFTTDAVNNALGDYAMYNRPAMARGNILQYVFVYKQYVITTLQMLKHLPMKSRMVFLLAILITAGISGIPFAEDLMDLLDTLAQASGMKVGSVQKELMLAAEDIMPGSSKYLMRGVFDHLFETTVSSRTGFGNILPLTGAFTAGADPWREASDFLGPVFGGMTGIAATGADAARYAAEAVGLKDDVTSLETILRESPVTAVRALTDAFVFTTDGRITNAQGKLVDDSVSAKVILSRALGFYPSAATQQNDVVRLSKQAADYAQEITRSYVNAATKARMDGDTDGYREIVNLVREWNTDARGTEFYIKDFGEKVRRAYKAAATPTGERYLDTAPTTIRADVRRLLDATGGY